MYDKILVDVILELWVSLELWVAYKLADILGDDDPETEEVDEEDSRELIVSEELLVTDPEYETLAVVEGLFVTDQDFVTFAVNVGVQVRTRVAVDVWLPTPEFVGVAVTERETKPERVPQLLAVLVRDTKADRESVRDTMPVREVVLVLVPDPVAVPERLIETDAVPVTVDVTVLDSREELVVVHVLMLESVFRVDAETDTLPFALPVPDSDGIPVQLCKGVGVHIDVNEKEDDPE